MTAFNECLQEYLDVKWLIASPILTHKFKFNVFERYFFEHLYQWNYWKMYSLEADVSQLLIISSVFKVKLTI